jgi:hypothetical protein
MKDEYLLDSAFNAFYKAAKTDYENGNLPNARRNYLKAAEALMKMAKSSPPALQKAQLGRAKKIVEIADSIEVLMDKQKKEKEVKATAATEKPVIEPQTQKEPEKIEPTRVEPAVITIAENPICLLPNVKPRIEFALATARDKIYLLIDTKHYVCTRKLNNYLSDEIDIETAGVYNVTVLSGSERIGECEITFTNGIQEKEFDI